MPPGQCRIKGGAAAQARSFGGPQLMLVENFYVLYCQGRPCDGRRHCVYVAMFYTRFQSAVNHVDQTTSVQN